MFWPVLVDPAGPFRIQKRACALGMGLGLQDLTGQTRDAIGLDPKDPQVIHTALGAATLALESVGMRDLKQVGLLVNFSVQRK